MKIFKFCILMLDKFESYINGFKNHIYFIYNDGTLQMFWHVIRYG